MTCANHPERENSAFCQNCGKPLCPECARTVGTAVFCEQCLAAKIGSVPPPSSSTGTGWQPVSGGAAYTAGGPVMPGPLPGAPNPGLAGLLGFIPGVGAMYNGQFAKGIVHLGIFAVLVSMTDHVSGVFGMFVAGWVFYMVFDAYQTAKARQLGTPLPNPFGLNEVGDKFGFGKAWPSHNATGPYTPPAADPYVAPVDPVAPPPPPHAGWGTPYAPPPPPPAYSVPPVAPVPPYDPNFVPRHRFPAGAIWLIGLGVIFLVGNIGTFGALSMHYLWPFLLIGFGVWMFIKKMNETGYSLTDDGSANYRWRAIRALRGSLWIVLIGILSLLDVLHILTWGHSWPIFLIALGLLAIAERAAYSNMNAEQFYTQQPVPAAPAPVATETHNEEAR